MDARSWLEAARQGHALDVKYDVAMMCTQPLVEDVRELVVETDLPWLLANLLTFDDKERAGFFPSLLAKFSAQPEVALEIRAAWFGASDVQKSKLCWRLVDLPSLSEIWHERIFDFVIDKWDTFQPISMDFYGKTPAARIAVIAERYFGEMFTPTKRWLYLCNAWFLRATYPALVAHLRDISQVSNFEFERRACLSLQKIHPF